MVFGRDIGVDGADSSSFANNTSNWAIFSDNDGIDLRS
jgi:hypothetical protein